MTDFDFDLFVIGGGSGGVRAARFAAQRGARVALAESGRMGGTCVNVGCIPKKLYSYGAHYAEAFEEARGYGWQLPGAPRLDWDALKARRAQEISRLNGIYEGLMTGAGVRRLQGHGRLLDAHTVDVTAPDGGRSRHRARHILLATGGTPVRPELPGHELIVTSDDMFDLPRFPRHLVVVGGGYIGCEMASIFHGLGAQVTLLYRGEQILRGFDDEVRDFTAAELRKAGIDLRVRTEVTRIEAAPDGTRRLTLNDGGVLQADVVLYAVGRRPNVAGLGLEAVGVRMTASGAIAVDEHFATAVPGLYALGDVRGGLELTPVALAEAMALVDHLFGPLPGQARRTMDYEHIPTAVFTHPPIGTVGLTEAQARARVGTIRVYRSDFRPLKHTLSGRDERCLVKLIVDDASDRVLGLHMVGADAGEIVQGFAVALKCGATKAQFDATLGIHPTSAEEFVTLRDVTRT
ncbi:MAG TPA: glutathione-disulfide reductase [Ottowia sp.]|uniref:glutathione-disulfide reductase n=1 Tax=Ottowia sp. TaxID=1898956 RepID=UPI0011D6EB18|nr:glutathione-disulfide reductase [Ottowia sp.]MCZ2089741.1 glutathione-disulfide reductase [Burkholderiales bacterium]TXI14343.1 MAG: glutathione-disulfide reductase [Ottowia sp.]HNE59129.1 glutathione-disulfide reductase [Ottowia sp.]HNI84019.1 glutathione-disulfide reductase [Ottowia sp.]HNJ45256.1 glutathione-disulfide reductase [Ottowia sp.]